eukprot:COSAG01_NODE_955_length_12483_cov_19.703731_10_plen_243_part_00
MVGRAGAWSSISARPLIRRSSEGDDIRAARPCCLDRAGQFWQRDHHVRLGYRLANAGADSELVHTACARAEGAAVSQAFPSLIRSILAEIYLCRACSCHEILRVETPGQAAGARGVLVAVGPTAGGGGPCVSQRRAQLKGGHDSAAGVKRPPVNQRWCTIRLDSQVVHTQLARRGIRHRLRHSRAVVGCHGSTSFWMARLASLKWRTGSCPSVSSRKLIARRGTPSSSKLPIQLPPVNTSSS